MAKSKSFFGLRRGSTKTLTFQVNNGKQITKDRVYEVKNPRTQEQMVQRMVMATASAAYAGMKIIVDHSFEGITYGQMNMSEFIRLNAKKLRENLGAANPTMCFNKYQDRTISPGAYIMSRGSAADLAYQPTIEDTVEDDVYTLKVQLGPVAAGNFTSKKLAQLFGVTTNDLITVCYLRWNSDKSQFYFGFVRFTFLKLDDETITLANLAERILVESNDAGQVIVANNGVSFITSIEDTDHAGYAACTIHSEKTANGWNRNNTEMDCSHIEANFMNYSESDAIATYPVGGSYVLNGGEVNG